MNEDAEIKVGTRVAPSRKWLRSVGLLTGPIPFLRGVVVDIEKFGTGPEVATIQWDPIGPKRLMASNLVPEDRLHLERV